MKATFRGGRLWLLAAAVLAVAAASGTRTEASSVGSMATGGLTSQPIGHYEFCQANVAECAIRTRDMGPMLLTDVAWSAIDTVNSGVNAAVQPLSDLDIYGRDEVWAYPVQGLGDCEDYVLEKRRQLAQSGFALSNLLITVVRKPDGEGHAVLTVRTDRGDFVLDNLNDDVKLWSDTGYRFLKRQASNHTGRWVTLRSEQNMLVGAVQ